MEGGQEQTREENADVDEEEKDFAFSRNCFLSKEHALGKKSAATRKLSDIAFVDEQVQIFKCSIILNRKHLLGVVLNEICFFYCLLLVSLPSYD